jgi:uncharacterized protein (DUF305 family)
MRHRGILIVAVGLIVVGLVGVSALFLLRNGPRPPGRGVDAMFIEQMIPHHEDAIAMSQIALERSERPEIIQLAEDIEQSQSAENAQMREWYQEWYGRDVPGVESRRRRGRDTDFGMMGRMTDLDALESAEDFDREFLEQMIPHHRMAVRMATMASNASRRPEMREFTESIAREQRREIELMEGWYREWYE